MTNETNKLLGRILDTLVGILTVLKNENDGEPTWEGMYVMPEEVEEYEAKGYRMADNFEDCHHGCYAVLMVRGGPDGEETADDEGEAGSGTPPAN